MSIDTVHRSARVEFRMSADLKREVEEAAILLGTTFTSFATLALVERAREVKREHSSTVLNDAERDALLALITSPPETNEPLRRLMRTEVNL